MKTTIVTELVFHTRVQLTCYTCSKGKNIPTHNAKTRVVVRRIACIVATAVCGITLGTISMNGFGSFSSTLNLLTWTKWWAPASASKWRMGFNSAFKGLESIAECDKFIDRNCISCTLCDDDFVSQSESDVWFLPLRIFNFFCPNELERNLNFIN